MEDKTIAFNNLSMLIEDTEVIMTGIWFNKYDEESFFNAIDTYFNKYEYKPNIIKGITSTIEFKPLLKNKNNHLKTLAKQLKKLSDRIVIKKVIDDEKSYLDFSIKNVIENRLNPLLNYVINEIELFTIEVNTIIKEKEPFNMSTNALASAMSGITGINLKTVQSYLNPIDNPSVNQKNNPLKRTNPVNKIEQKLISIGFKQ